MTPRVVLDAWAMLAFLQAEEPASTGVRRRLEQALEDQVLLYLSIINAGEVLYRVGKVKGEAEAGETWEQLRRLPMTVLPATEETVLAAAALKMRHAISYADAFAAAAAQDLGATLMTGDPELLMLDEEIDLEPLSRRG